MLSKKESDLFAAENLKCHIILCKLHKFYPKFFNFKVVSSRLGLEVGSEDIQKNGRLARGPVVGCV